MCRGGVVKEHPNRTGRMWVGFAAIGWGFLVFRVAVLHAAAKCP